MNIRVGDKVTPNNKLAHDYGVVGTVTSIKGHYITYRHEDYEDTRPANELLKLTLAKGKLPVVETVTRHETDHTSFSTDPAQRKGMPICTGVLDYFPDALAAVAEVSRIGNEQHNPGQSLHWERSKSTDHADCLLRHLADRGKLDTDGVRHSAKVVWRALALLQLEIEKERTK